MGTCFEGLLLHSNVHWLSQGAVLSRVYELWREVVEFFSTEKHQMADCFTNVTWIHRLASMSDTGFVQIFHGEIQVLFKEFQGQFSNLSSTVSSCKFHNVKEFMHTQNDNFIVLLTKLHINSLTQLYVVQIKKESTLVNSSVFHSLH